MLSIIVPIWNEESVLPTFLKSVSGLSSAEIVIVDGGSRDQTRKLLLDWSAQSPERRHRLVWSSHRGRGKQMNEGVKAASGDLLLFLHADTRLHPGALERIVETLRNPSVVGGAFRLQIDSTRFFLRCVEKIANWRSELFTLPYGDQGYFVRRAAFERLGGFKEIPLMEDVDFIRRLKRLGQCVILKEAVVTSARRWKRQGILYTSLRNAVLLTLYCVGIAPQKLAKWYDY